MKTWKKISAWLLAFGMLLSLMTTMPVKADEKTGKIIIHKYVVEKLEQYRQLKDAGDRAKGNVINFADHNDLKDLKPMAGINFELQRVEDDGTSVLTPDKVTPLGDPISGTTKADGTLTFDNLALGTYKLSELDDLRVSQKMDPVLISVPTYNQEYKTDTNKQEFLYEIHVYPKNLIHQDGPSIEKDVVQEDNNDATVDLKTPFEWIIRSDIPDDKGQKAKKYVITDKLDSRLDFVEDISVELRSADGQATATLLKGTDYTFETKDLTGEGHKPGNNRDLTWTLTDDGLTKLTGYQGGKVVTKFTTMLNETAELGTAIPNKASLDYTNWNNHEYLPESDIPEVHTGGVKIKKVDKENHDKVLQGAEFMVYSTKELAIEGKPEKAVQREGKPYVVTSNTDGIAFFEGLSYGDPTGNKPNQGSTTYWIVETKAPKVGDVQYNRLLDPFEVEVSATSHTNPLGMYTVYNAKDNYKLPFTGGTGLLVFLGAGAVLLIAANMISKGGKNKTAK